MQQDLISINVPIAFYAPETDINKIRNDALEQIVKFSGKKHLGNHFVKHYPVVKIEIIEKNDEVQGKNHDYLNTIKSNPITKFKVLNFSVFLEFELEDNPYRELTDIDEDNAAILYLDAYINLLLKYILDLTLCANIALPGSLQFSKCDSFINGSWYQEHTGAVNDWDNLFELSDRLKWPNLSKMAISSVWEWIEAIDGFDEGVGKGSLGRSLAAISYLFHKNTQTENMLDLIWSLMALESLYGKSNTALKDQLLSKSEAFLGPRLENKKKFGWMYDFRSRFIHGDIDFVFQSHIYDGSDEYKKFRDEIYESSDIANLMLVGTLQKMASLMLYEMNFEYSLKE
jgi:hypothetical protein